MASPSLMMFSASYVNALYDSSASVKNNPFYYIKNQLLFALIGLIAMYVISKIRYDFYREISFAVLLISYVLLILVLAFILLILVLILIFIGAPLV